MVLMMVALAAALSPGSAFTLFRLISARRSPGLLLLLRAGGLQDAAQLLLLPLSGMPGCCCMGSLAPPLLLLLLLACCLPWCLLCGSRSATPLVARCSVICACSALLSCLLSSSAPAPPLQLLP
jgi:hypothetical protein